MPVVLAAVLAAVVWQHGIRESLRAFSRAQVWIPVAVISAVFVLPIAVNLALHWPGDFGKYFSYTSSSRAGGHGLGQIVRYALWFWWQGGHTWAAALVPVVSYAVAIAAVGWLSRGAMRRFLAALLAVNVVSTLAFACYAAVGIDSLSHYYIGYFYFSAPIITLLVIALAVVHAPPAPWVPCWLSARLCSASPRSPRRRPRRSAPRTPTRPCRMPSRRWRPRPTARPS